MRRQSEECSATDLKRLERDLAEWRRNHGAPTPIPEKMWERAADLCAGYGVGTVARELRLNHTHLKRRVHSPLPVETAPAFIELLPSAIVGDAVAECALEIESRVGARMRVVMKNVPSVCLAAILREFAG